jgi:hypothetical protein
MSALSEMQDAFKRYLLLGDNEPELAAEVRASGGVSAEARLDVYRNAYYVRLQEALAHDFPSVLAFLGDAEFGRLIAAYLSQQPSTRPSLRWLGERFANFLLAACLEPAASELAQLEWAVLHALDAPDTPSLTGLQDVPASRWPELRIALHPSVSLLSVHANVHEIRGAALDAKPLPPLRRDGEFLIVFRAGAIAAVEVLDAGAHSLLLALGGGHDLAEACEAIAGTRDAAQVPDLVAGTLHRGCALGWFSEGTG